MAITQEHPSVVSTYDFLVVGAGSSGSVVAARLADTGASVASLLILTILKREILSRN